MYDGCVSFIAHLSYISPKKERIDIMIRVTWKDSSEYSKSYKTTKYRKHMVTRYSEGAIRGWVTDVEGDEYVYKTIDMAYNAIDEMLGTPPRVNNERRKAKGIEIVCKKNEG